MGRLSASIHLYFSDLAGNQLEKRKTKRALFFEHKLSQLITCLSSSSVKAKRNCLIKSSSSSSLQILALGFIRLLKMTGTEWYRGNCSHRGVQSFPQPLGHVLVGEFDLHISRAGVGELIPAVRVAKVAPHPFELRRDVVVSVFLWNHLREANAYRQRIVEKSSDRKKLHILRSDTLTTWSLGRRLQSASVSSSPSRYLRVDSAMCRPTWTSLGSAPIRYSSSLARALSKLFSNAVKGHR